MKELVFIAIYALMGVGTALENKTRVPDSNVAVIALVWPAVATMVILDAVDERPLPGSAPAIDTCELEEAFADEPCP